MFEPEFAQFAGALAHRDASADAVAPLSLAVIVPVRNERDNVAELVTRLRSALAGRTFEVIFVDDASTDGTGDAVEAIGRQDRSVRLIRRFNRRGLSSAVIEGMLATMAPVVAVIDGDLQHDEAILPDLVARVEAGFDIAIGTRYSGGGSTGGWSRHRIWISKFASRLALQMTKVPVSDPMSGYFAMSRARLLELAPALSGVGYKILLDVLSTPESPMKVTEVPYTFRTRIAGESKLDSAVVTQYLEMLWDKRFGKFVSSRFIKFAGVGLLGLGVHMSVLTSSHAFGMAFGVAQALAVSVAIGFNFLLNNSFTYRDRRLRGAAFLRGMASFYAICLVGAVANVGAGVAMFSQAQNWWLAGVTGAAVGSIWNYAMGSVFTWRR